ncbi:hypothetical protein BVF91_07465 [Thermoanaerobacterium sp. PSU-2]|uniref:hypothetical protein n=1 Tax=Thermoanaerobacterium sp. PSU-2 TaxID=1930849 RepID=UPI000A14C743|nr:hypothetical protein [Thermoanaerobacterium sp. PSU-2]ORX23355.1 hypothetical protein BVF91_07465 [Thermoanaerobacterium sp. PSU-2]
MNVFIALIGSNPLPIYAVLNYLLNDSREDKKELPCPDIALCVHSEDTCKYFENIKKLIGNKLKFEQINLGFYERDPKTIKEQIKKKLSSLNEENSKKDTIESIHLNYTGGTKVMSVISYNEVKNYCKNNNIECVFSDLDPKTNKINVIVNDDIEVKKYPFDGDLRDYIKVKAPTLFKLHNMEVNESELGDELYFSKIDIDEFSEKALKLLNKNDRDFKNAYDLLSQEISKYKLEYGYDVKKIKENTGCKKSFGKLKEIFGDIIPYKDLESAPNPQVGNLCEFLTGKWLEDYILCHLRNIKNDVKVDNLYKSVRVRYNNRPCEIDVIAIKGYCTYLFSCTISQRIKIIKEKAFEAIYRANQLAGEHAKVIVVSPISSDKSKKDNNLEELKKDLSSFDAINNKKVEYLSIDDLIDTEKLENKLKKFFQDEVVE